MTPTDDEGSALAPKPVPLLLTRAHRPFFLLTAIYGALAIAIWIVSWRGYGSATSLWHGHEMIFGFAGAGLAGFLLTAIPNWTKQPPAQGVLLGVLLSLWFAGRLAIGVEQLLWLDLLFLPALGLKALIDIVRARNHRNLIVPVLIFGLAGFNFMYHFGDPRQALALSVYTLTAMITLIAGRIAPLFTMVKLGIKNEPPLLRSVRVRLTQISVPLVLMVGLAEWVFPGTATAGWIAFGVAIILGALMLTWHGYRSFREPLIWIMHAGFIWVPVGFMLKALNEIWNVGTPSSALHALTAGAIGGMLLAVSSRAALGHSGKPLEATKLLVLAYLMVIAAAVVRVFAPSNGAIDASATLWILGFGFYAIVLWPVLTRPRQDGKPG